MDDQNFKKKPPNKICLSFLKKFTKDLKNKENWKLKAVYFFFLSGIVVLWVQMTIHQKSLNFSDRDIAYFVSMSSIIAMVVPFASGFVADKIGNFSQFTSILIILLGVNSFCFNLVKPINFVDSNCNINQSETFQKVNQSASSSASLVEKIKCIQNSINQSRSILDDDNFNDKNVDCKNSATEDVVDRTVGGSCNDTGSRIMDQRSYRKTYWTYFTIYACFMMLTGASFSLFDGTVMALLKESSTDYGLQRAWGTLAALVASYLGGVLVDCYSIGMTTKDFTLMFYTSGFFLVIAGLITVSINLSFKLPATNYSKDLWRDIKKFEMFVLMFLIVFKGFFMAYAETFMYLFMSNLGASSSLIGLTVTVGASFEIGLQLLATPLIKVLGKVSVISLGIICYSIRFIGFSYAYNPVVMVYLEVLDCWASGLTITAIVMHCTVLSSPTTIASMRGLISLLHDGIGKFLGATIGIEIKELLGDRVSWRVMSLSAFLVASVYFIIMKRFKSFKKRKYNNKNVASNGSQCQLQEGGDKNSTYGTTQENLTHFT